MKPFISIFLVFLLFPNLVFSLSNQDKYNDCVMNCKVTWSMLPYAETEYHIEKCIKDECNQFLEPTLLSKEVDTTIYSHNDLYELYQKENSKSLDNSNQDLISISNKDSKSNLNFIEYKETPKSTQYDYKAASCLPNQQNIRNPKLNNETKHSEQKLESFAIDMYLLAQAAIAVLVIYLIYRFYCKKNNHNKRRAYIDEESPYIFLQV